MIIFIWLYDTTDMKQIYMVYMVYPFSQLIGHWCVPKVLPHGLLMLFNVGDFVGLVPWIVTPDDTREWKAQNRGISPHSKVFQVGDIIPFEQTCGMTMHLPSMWHEFVS